MFSALFNFQDTFSSVVIVVLASDSFYILPYLFYVVNTFFEKNSYLLIIYIFRYFSKYFSIFMMNISYLFSQLSFICLLLTAMFYILFFWKFTVIYMLLLRGFFVCISTLEYLNHICYNT